MSFHHELVASLHLNALRDVGPMRFQRLIDAFESAVAAVAGGPKSWSGIPLFDSVVLDRVTQQWSAAQNLAFRDSELIERTSARCLLRHQGPYPERLKQISSPPPVLYVRGNVFQFDRPAIALVGSRKSSFYAEKWARKLAADLAAAQVVTVSGLARGIDTCIHEATVKEAAETWSVLGSGLSFVYPPENRRLADRILEHGCLISEFPMNARPHPSSFPRRNRIISGLSLGTVVVEGGDKSGSLITARLAADQGRDVMALPGPVGSPGSVAPHMLIKAGAALVENVDDVLRVVGLEVRNLSAAIVADGGANQEILRLIDYEPVSRDILAERLKKPLSDVCSLLLQLELQGLIRCLPSGGVVKI